jgi:hypothetical protein
MQRKYAFYEYTGMMKQVFSDERRLGIDFEEYQLYGNDLNRMSRFLTRLYNVGDFEPKKPEVAIYIDYGDTKTRGNNILKMMILERTNKVKFHRMVFDIVTIKPKVLPNNPS